MYKVIVHGGGGAHNISILFQKTLAFVLVVREETNEFQLSLFVTSIMYFATTWAFLNAIKLVM